MFETIRIETDDRGVATLTLARAEKHNALSAQMIEELTEAAKQLGEDPAVRIVVLAADGRTFCAGGDLGWMRQQIDADSETRAAGARKLAMMLYALNTLPKPVIARVQGNAFGGGVGMMAVSDVVIAADSATFGLTEVKLGLIPATIGPYVLARIGEEKGRRLFLSARLFSAIEAERINLVSHVVPFVRLDDAVETEVSIFLQTAPGAVAAAKAQCRAYGPQIDEARIQDSIDRLIAIWEGPEVQEGISAFFEKRKPSWVV